MAPTLTEVRALVASQVDAIDGLTVTARPVDRPKAGYGWVTLGTITPSSSFGLVSVDCSVVVHLGADILKSSTLYEEWGPKVAHALSQSEVGLADIEVNPERMLVGVENVSVYAMTATFTVEVESGA